MERVESMRSKEEEEEKRGRQWTERETVEESLSLSHYGSLLHYLTICQSSQTKKPDKVVQFPVVEVKCFLFTVFHV